jgi:hypothetical protein
MPVLLSLVADLTLFHGNLALMVRKPRSQAAHLTLKRRCYHVAYTGLG